MICRNTQSLPSLADLARRVCEAKEGTPRSARRILRKFVVLSHYDFRCAFCGMDFLESVDAFLLSSLDHLVPRSAGGVGTQGNLVAACLTCNQLKDNRVVETIESARHLVEKRRRLFGRVLDEVVTVFSEAGG